MRRSLLLALLFAAGAPAAENRRTGSVIYATAKRLYLDAGARDGLTAGQVLRLKSGPCRIDQVSATHATCAGSGRPGETFALPEPPPALVARRLPPPPPQAVVEQRRAIVASAAFEKVEYRGPAGPPPRSETVEIGIGHTTWASTGAYPWQRERADAWVRGAPVGAGFPLDVALSARRWSRRSDPISFRPDDPAQLYVWEAALSRRPVTGPVFSLGRVRPWSVPGQPILDGAQAGWRTSGGNEAGVFGGVVPDPVTLAPSLEHGTFGAYWAGQHTGDPSSTLRFFRHELRLAFVNTADLGRRVEGEGLLEARVTRRFDAGLAVRVAAGDREAPGHLDAVRVNGAARPIDGLSIDGSFRYEGLSVPELDGPGGISSYGGAARHADLSMSYEPTKQIRVSVLSGLSTDLTAGHSRGWVGPEIGAPRLFSERAGVSIGYALEGGWEPGQSAWLQVVFRPATLLQLLTRFSWYRTRYSSPVDLDELAASMGLQAQLGRFVALRLSAVGRTTLNGQTELFGAATGQSGVLDAEIAGQF